MNSKCLDCNLPLTVYMTSENTKNESLKDSKWYFETKEEQAKAAVPLSLQVQNQTVHLFSKQEGPDVQVDLILGDLIEGSIKEGGIKLQQPICSECFDKIFTRLNAKIKDQEESKKVYAEQLSILEDEIQLRNKLQNAKEVQELAEEERLLDAELEQIGAEEAAQEREICELGKYHATIESEEAKYWADFN